jgi:predicted MFS family arabinose efflux permease
MFSSVAVSVGGSMLFVFVPVLVDGLRQEGFTAREAGLIASGGTFGMFLGAIVALIVTHLSRRTLAWIGAVMLLVGCLTATTSNDLVVLCAAALLAGTGGGLNMGVGHAAMSQTNAPERAYALFLVVQTLLASAVIMALSSFAFSGPDPAFLASAAVLAASAIMIPALPKRTATLSQSGDARSPISIAFGLLIVATFFIWGVALLAVWSFAEAIAEANAIDGAQFSQSLSVALIGGVVGAGVVVAIGRRWGRIAPLLVIGSGYFLAMILFALPLTALLFLLAAFAFQVAVQSPSYAFGALVETDEHGRPGILYLLGLKAGFGVAPLVGANVLEEFSLAGLVAFSAVGGAISYALFVFIILRSLPLIQKRKLQAALP